jgi:hypothetical protein
MLLFTPSWGPSRETLFVPHPNTCYRAKSAKTVKIKCEFRNSNLAIFLGVLCGLRARLFSPLYPGPMLAQPSQTGQANLPPRKPPNSTFVGMHCIPKTSRSDRRQNKLRATIMPIKITIDMNKSNLNKTVQAAAVLLHMVTRNYLRLPYSSFRRIGISLAMPTSN